MTIRREFLSDTETPVSLLAALESGFACVALYESVEGSERWARRSLLALSREPTRLATTPDEVKPLVESLGLAREPKSLLEGAFGYFTWEAAQAFIPLPNLPAATQPLAEFFKPEVVLLYDHRRHVVEALFRDDKVEKFCMDALARPRPMQLVELTEAKRVVAKRHVTREAYVARVERAKDYIAAGDAFQIVVSQRFSAPAKPMLDVYRYLRRDNPSPYLFYLRTPQLEAAGASPETLVRVENGTVTVRPLAGTRRRGRNETEDQALAAELLADEKERAEHVMLVDLGRNDVGRVAAAGTVRVEPLMQVERYSHVMHLVSEVQGALREDCDALAAFASAFPAGTLSGAPKKRAMEIIGELEQAPRGLYGGAVGYFAGSHACDFAIAIRTAWREGDHCALQAGAGVVYDSQPIAEDEECLRKAASPLAACGAKL
jgi:anthranilate synthase component 1